MRVSRTIVFAFAFTAFVAYRAAAQDAGQIGISMGYPGSIGVVWHVTDAVAVRPDFIFTSASSGLAGVDDTTTSVGIGISGLVYVTKDDRLRTYVVPRFTYRRTTSEVSAVYATSVPAVVTIGLASPVLQPATFKSTTTQKGLSGAFGAQYAIHERFGIFGEVGFGYAESDYEPGLAAVTLPALETGPHSWSTQSAVGIVFYFKD